ncbi:MAG: hypothetical protein KDA65_05460 [Planctomycetaceae bacterium]|nr:hypothetical protein [Planctomycetaceae bacterium]
MKTEDINGLNTAIIESNLTESDIREIRESVEGLWIKPTSPDFFIETPLCVPLLKKIFIQDCSQSWSEIIKVSHYETLQNLVVSNSLHFFENIELLGILPSMTSIIITNQPVEEKLAHWICSQPNLIKLRLNRETGVTDSVIASLSCKETLRLLDVSFSDVTFSDNVMNDVAFNYVRYLGVSATRVSSQSVEVIRSAFPNLECFMGWNTALTLDDVKKIATWKKIVRLMTDMPEVDFDRYPYDLWIT